MVMRRSPLEDSIHIIMCIEDDEMITSEAKRDIELQRSSYQ